MVPAEPSVDGTCAGHGRFDPESAEWLRALMGSGTQHDEAVARLHKMLVRTARSELQRRRTQLPVTGPEIDDLAHQAAADALVAITRKLGQFRGDSRFTTWAYAFVMFEVSSKVGRHFWRRPRQTMEPEDWDRLPDRFGVGPAEAAQTRAMVDAIRRAVDEELTIHQRRVFVSIVVEGVPLDALVDALGSNRNAIYKTMFDARRKVRAALVADGYLEQPRARHP